MRQNHHLLWSLISLWKTLCLQRKEKVTYTRQFQRSSPDHRGMVPRRGVVHLWGLYYCGECSVLSVNLHVLCIHSCFTITSFHLHWNGHLQLHLCTIITKLPIPCSVTTKRWCSNITHLCYHHCYCNLLGLHNCNFFTEENNKQNWLMMWNKIKLGINTSCRLELLNWAQDTFEHLNLPTINTLGSTPTVHWSHLNRVCVESWKPYGSRQKGTEKERQTQERSSSCWHLPTLCNCSEWRLWWDYHQQKL